MTIAIGLTGRPSQSSVLCLPRGKSNVPMYLPLAPEFISAKSNVVTKTSLIWTLYVSKCISCEGAPFLSDSLIV